MKRILWVVSVLVIASGTGVSALGAQQSFQGTGQEATDLFLLDAGLVVFEMEHRGTGPFTVRLLDERGALVEELASGTGAFRGSKAVGVPQEGRYLLDVSATGPWTVRRRAEAVAPTTQMPDTASAVYKAAAAAAREVPTNGWIGRGFIGGVLGGPVGAAIVVGIADRSGVPGASAGVDGGTDPGPGFDAAFAARVRESRKRKAFLGGMLGSGVFLAGLVWAIQIAQGGEGGGAGTPDGGGGQFVIVPR